MRHGTTTLFAALNVLEGTVIGECQPRHRHQEFLRFLDRIDKSVEGSVDIHFVLDNYGTHKHPEVRDWLADRPRYHMHFTPTSSSWLNQVERWFAEITRKRIRRGTFRSVRELTKAINDYIRIYNKSPRPFQWVASASRIVQKVNRYRRTLGTTG
jgi:putative transposase